MIKCFHSTGYFYVYIVIFIVNLSSFSAGNLMGWTSPMQSKLTGTDDNPLDQIVSDDEVSWLASIINLGCVIGYFIYRLITEKFGRRIAVILTVIPAFVSQLMLILVKDLTWFYVARVLGGLSMAGTFFVIPIYAGEISPNKIRGFLSSLTVLIMFSGVLFTACVGPYVSYLAFNIILLVPLIILLAGTILLVPESPHYYVYKKDETKARKALIHLRGTTDINEEFEDIKKNADVEQSNFIEMFKDKAGLRAFIIATCLNVSRIFTAFGPILSYTQSIFESTGSNIDPAISSIIVNSVQLGSGFLSSLVVDRFGRRFMLLLSISGIILNQIVFGIYYFLKDNVDVDVSSVSWLPLLSLILMLIFMSIGLSPLASVIVGEVFPINFKADGILIAISVGAIGNFIATLFFNNMVDGIGMGPTIWIYSGGLVCFAIYIYFFIFETKGKSLQEIQDILKS